MSITDIALLSFIIFAFVALAAALAWGDYQTRDIAKASRARALADVRDPAPEQQEPGAHISAETNRESRPLEAA